MDLELWLPRGPIPGAAATSHGSKSPVPPQTAVRLRERREKLKIQLVTAAKWKATDRAMPRNSKQKGRRKNLLPSTCCPVSHKGNPKGSQMTKVKNGVQSFGPCITKQRREGKVWSWGIVFESSTASDSPLSQDSSEICFGRNKVKSFCFQDYAFMMVK